MKPLSLAVILSLLFEISIMASESNDTLPPLKLVNVGWTHSDPLMPDSSNFITASLLVITPGERIYSTPGHCAIRLECPIHNLDYCFSMETGTRWIDFLKFYSGKSKAKFHAFETPLYLGLYAAESRGVTQYELNLTLHEKQRLWQLLDQDMTQNVEITYNLLKDNCISKGILTIEDALIGEKLIYGEMPPAMDLVNGKLARYIARRAPWVEFLYATFLGTESDTFWDIEYRLSPELVAEILQHAQFVSDDVAFKRPVLGGNKKLLEQLATERQYIITPTIAFAALLILVLIISLHELKTGKFPMAKYCDISLFTLQTIAGIFLLYMTVYSGLFGYHWNWYLIPCNPLPAVLWLFLRHKSWWSKIYVFYSVVLVIFLALTPVSEQIDLPHQLITATLAVRCTTKCLIDRKRK